MTFSRQTWEFILVQKDFCSGDTSYSLAILFVTPWETFNEAILVGGLEHFSCFHSVWNLIIPIDFHMFQIYG